VGEELNLTQIDSQENSDENGSIGSNNSIEENLELISVEENNDAIHELPQPPNPELIVLSRCYLYFRSRPSSLGYLYVHLPFTEI